MKMKRPQTAGRGARYILIQKVKFLIFRATKSFILRNMTYLINQKIKKSAVGGKTAVKRNHTLLKLTKGGLVGRAALRPEPKFCR